ncbi:MAG: hypothetical protein WBH47_09310 [Streptosporangiaceae bacterium]
MSADPVSSYGVTTARSEGGLAFWLRYVESRGGLWERSAGRALVMVPPDLQRTFGLPEELTATEHPDIAREDGAVLLTTGHPLLTAAAEDALKTADVGHLTLAEPAVQRPDDGRLLERAREHVPVDHGRIDARGPAERGMHDVLRLGALVTYDASADDRFYEQTECWLDVPSRLELPGSVMTRLRHAVAGAAASAAAGGLNRAPADVRQVPAALAEAHRVLERAASERSAALAAGPAREAAEAELGRTQRYYAAQLAALTKRAARAPADRRELLVARAESVRAEERRRLDEVREKYSPRHEIRPYRLHLLRVPALSLPVDVLRGPRRFPLRLEWLLPVGTFAPLRCPQCSADTAQHHLVVAKTHLGCARCLPRNAVVSLAPPVNGEPRAAVPASAVPVVPAPAVAAPASRAPRMAARLRDPQAGSAPSSRPPARAESARHPHAAVPRSARSSGSAQPDPRALARSGERLAMDFWSAASQMNLRALRRMCLPDSPAAAVLRLFGWAGPAMAVGLTEHDLPQSLTSATFPGTGGELASTGGYLETGRGRHGYLLRWQVGARRVSEILPFDSLMLGNLAAAYWLRGPARARTFGGLPDPAAELDPVASRLWRKVVPAHGLPLTLRCLAAWWRIGDVDALAAYRPSELAAAIHRLVGYRAGEQGVSYDTIAGVYKVEGARLRALTSPLQARLKLSADQPW